MLNKGQEIIQKLLSSETRVRIVLLFRDNPGLLDTDENVAIRVGKKAKSIEADLKELTEIGILNTRKVGTYSVVSFNKRNDQVVQKAIEDYFRNT